MGTKGVFLVFAHSFPEGVGSWYRLGLVLSATPMINRILDAAFDLTTKKHEWENSVFHELASIALCICSAVVNTECMKFKNFQFKK